MIIYMTGALQVSATARNLNAASSTLQYLFLF